MKEIWKDIIGFEGYYMISNLGNLYSVRSKQNKVICLNACGYLRTRITCPKNKGSFLVHRLVAAAFIPNPKKYKEVNHVDGNKTNNHVSNLEWCDRSRNCKHAVDIGLNPPQKGEDAPRAKLCNEDVFEIRRLKGKISGYRLSKKYNVDRCTIYRIWNHKNWTHI
jgi:hypothetical protein